MTERERQVLQLIVEGHTSSRSSQRLYISPRTVESHRTNLMRKLGVGNQRELVRYATQRGILPPAPTLPSTEEGGRADWPAAVG